MSKVDNCQVNAPSPIAPALPTICERMRRTVSSHNLKTHLLHHIKGFKGNYESFRRKRIFHSKQCQTWGLINNVRPEDIDNVDSRQKANVFKGSLGRYAQEK